MKKLYLTKRQSNNTWNYITDPLHPTSVQQMGVIAVDNDEIRVDEFGAYVLREFKTEATCIPSITITP